MWVLERALDLLFPPRCKWCDAVVGFGSCVACETQADMLRERNAVPGTAHGRVGTSLAAVCYPYRYEAEVKQLVHRYKFKGKRELVGAMAGDMAAQLALCGLKADMLVPVPQTEMDRKRKGFDQTLLLAKELARQTGLLCSVGQLVKIRQTKQQAGLNRAQRAINLKGAFAVCEGHPFVGKHILLLDDVVTTGYTAQECAQTLLDAGAAECSLVCFAGTTLEQE